MEGSTCPSFRRTTLFSFIATCERHRVNRFEYLRDVLDRIVSTTISKLAELLPGNWKP